ncbi:hypothetical protein C8N35_101343 [Breoghania corrubedonensis]|uniref:Uncharacterized protein n=1 Tax=Breoghania corrubedonensis TaxID=665038 RepID=A0A2T5VEX8_9HYPH|nr:hypothetical protein [Breoghania corrubedonensis]PTW62303.1 hypothetical protein C8N35_101343 [Breoghania corrubedonensis]
MPSTRPRSIARLAVVAAIGLGMTGCMSNSEGMYGSDGTAPDVALVKGLMKSIGAVDPNEKPINYQPRAPLAIPSDQKDLPSPETAAATPANWPRDKDAELAAIQKANDRREAEANINIEKSSHRLGIEEVKKGTLAGNDRLKDGPGSIRDDGSWENSQNRLTIEQMKGQKMVKPEDTAKLFDANGKPQRNYLIEPPVEYSTPAATAALPDVEAIKKEKVKPATDTIDDYDPRRDTTR